MDGDNGINIIYASTLKHMGIPLSKLNVSHMQFHEVIAGKKPRSLGLITLEVVLREKIFSEREPHFEVVDF